MGRGCVEKQGRRIEVEGKEEEGREGGKRKEEGKESVM